MPPSSIFSLQLLIGYGYLIIFPLMIIEGHIITVIAEFLASLGYFNVFTIYSLMVLADLTGDTIYYAIQKHDIKEVMKAYESLYKQLIPRK